MKKFLVSNRRRLLAGALATGVLPLIAAGSGAWAAPTASAPTASAPASSGPVGLTFTLLSRGTVAKPFKIKGNGVEIEAQGVTDVVVAGITLDPMGTSGWHVHPGPAVVTVTSGTVTLKSRDCTRQTYTAGQTFIEKGTRDPAKASNAGSTTAQLVATFFVPTGANPLLTTTPPPACAG